MRATKAFALFALLTLFATACGQKPGVHVGFAGGGGGGAGGQQLVDGTAPSSTEFFDADGDGLDDATGQGADGFIPSDTTGTSGGTTGTSGGTTGTSGGTTGTSGGTTGTSGSRPGTSGGTTGTPSGTAGTSGGGAGTPSGGQPAGGQPAGGQPAGGQPAGGQPAGGQPAGGQPQQPAGPGDSTGITADEIIIGIHAPLSGAAPLPQDSFNSGKDQYWIHVGEVAGRTVRVIVANDEYNPSRAKSVCDQLIQQEKVFVLVGGGGADQIAACARTAAQQGVPYLSAGVDEGVLTQLPNYFASSMSYVQQAPLLVQWISKNARPSNNIVGIVRDSTPSFNNVVGAMQQGLQDAGFEVRVRNTSSPTSDAQWLASNGIETAFPIMAPSYFLQIFGAPGGQIENWTGIGITMGLNTVASVGCSTSGAFDGSMFFSPFPGLNQIDALDPEFRRAGGSDDIELALWGLNKSLHAAFQAMGDNLTRQAFVQALESTTIDTNVYPTQEHGAHQAGSRSHFGTDQVHVLIADCGSGEFVTPDNGVFATGF